MVLLIFCIEDEKMKVMEEGKVKRKKFEKSQRKQKKGNTEKEQIKKMITINDNHQKSISDYDSPYHIHSGVMCGQLFGRRR